MIRSFSFSVQQIIAVGLLLLAVLCALLFIVVPWGQDLSDDLGRLARSREEIGRLTQIRAQPVTPSLPGPSLQSIIIAPDAQAANRMLAGLLTLVAARSNVMVTPEPTRAGMGAPPMLLTMSFTARGEQSAVLSFLNSLESGTVVLRFRQVTLQTVVPSAAIPPSDMLPATTSSIMPQSPNASTSTVAVGQVPVNATPPSLPTDSANAATAPLPIDAASQLEVHAVIEGVWGRRP